MLSVLKHPVYAKLFGAQVIALVGTGLLTVALGLLAFDLAGVNGGAVMGLAMTIKMVAYVAVAPVISALTARLPRKPLLITADLVRAAVALCLPFITEAWQIYVLIFLLQSASATFTPAFQALIPSVLPREADYTRALSFSRLAYDLEALASPALAALLLTVMSYHNLFAGTVVGFLGSAVLVLLTRLPAIAPPDPSGFFDRLTRGVRTFFAVRELRGLLALNFVVATSTAMVIVNTVVMVKGELGRTQPDAALLLGANGAGSMLVALVMPRLLERVDDHRVMLWGAAFLPAGLACAAAVLLLSSGASQWFLLLMVWFFLGAATSAALTPSSRLLRRNTDERSAPAVFAAQFSLSHACYLVTYPLAGSLGALWGLPAVAVLLAGLGTAGVVALGRAWPVKGTTAGG
ncbi:MFS transporter [Galactobacter valiniphilus]|uniref:MFS transporter n=1 Tax=Galactobacter valiniphilus TaxID=2676122 RepID=UPI00373525BD